MTGSNRRFGCFFGCVSCFFGCLAADFLALAFLPVFPDVCELVAIMGLGRQKNGIDGIVVFVRG
jgi:hypothetical protein